MREILFRGKQIYTREWVEGNLVNGTFYFNDRPMTVITPINTHFYGNCEIECYERVIPETVGQWTGLVDKNGTKIYEGDIVSTEFGRTCIVQWFKSPAHCGWDLIAIANQHNINNTKPPLPNHLFASICLEVIGNIHDNPKLLENDMEVKK